MRKEWKKRGWVVLSSTGDCVLFLECQNVPTGAGRAAGFKEIHWRPTELEYIGKIRTKLFIYNHTTCTLVKSNLQIYHQE